MKKSSKKSRIIYSAFRKIYMTWRNVSKITISTLQRKRWVYSEEIQKELEPYQTMPIQMMREKTLLISSKNTKQIPRNAPVKKSTNYKLFSKRFFLRLLSWSKMTFMKEILDNSMSSKFLKSSTLSKKNWPKKIMTLNNSKPQNQCLSVRNHKTFKCKTSMPIRCSKNCYRNYMINLVWVKTMLKKFISW